MNAMKVCITNNFMEHQAYKISEEIRKQSLYKVVKVEVFGGKSFEFSQQDEQWNGKDFITKIILEDKKGALFSVKPDYSGLRFAKGEITYNEYNKMQKKEDVKGVWYFSGIIGSFMLMMFILMKFVT